MPPYLHQNCLDTTSSGPLRKYVYLVWVNLSIGLVYKGQVDSGYELDCRRCIRIRFATHNVETVDAILMYSLQMVIRQIHRWL